MNTGDHVALTGTVMFVRSGFAKVRWDNGSTSYEWAAELSAVIDSPQPTTATGQPTDE